MARPRASLGVSSKPMWKPFPLPPSLGYAPYKISIDVTDIDMNQSLSIDKIQMPAGSRAVRQQPPAGRAREDLEVAGSMLPRLPPKLSPLLLPAASAAAPRCRRRGCKAVPPKADAAADNKAANRLSAKDIQRSASFIGCWLFHVFSFI